MSMLEIENQSHSDSNSKVTQANKQESSSHRRTTAERRDGDRVIACAASSVAAKARRAQRAPRARSCHERCSTQPVRHRETRTDRERTYVSAEASRDDRGGASSPPSLAWPRALIRAVVFVGMSEASSVPSPSMPAVFVDYVSVCV